MQNTKFVINEILEKLPLNYKVMSKEVLAKPSQLDDLVINIDSSIGYDASRISCNQFYKPISKLLNEE
jgi:hypothetical protein